MLSKRSLRSCSRNRDKENLKAAKVSEMIQRSLISSIYNLMQVSICLPHPLKGSFDLTCVSPALARYPWIACKWIKMLLQSLLPSPLKSVMWSCFYTIKFICMVRCLPMLESYSAAAPHQVSDVFWSGLFLLSGWKLKELVAPKLVKFYFFITRIFTFLVSALYVCCCFFLNCEAFCNVGSCKVPK